jgi:hypothetical protein
MAQLLIAAAVMVLGYDALNALENWTIAPIAGGELAALVANQTGLAEDLDLETVVAAGAGWPPWLSAVYSYVVTAPAFLILGVLGTGMALLFRSRG